MSNIIFHDSGLQAQFEKDGFVTIQLIPEEEIKTLKAFYDSIPGTGQKGFHASMFNPSTEIKIGIDKRIKDAVGNRMGDILVDYRGVYANFMVKEPGPDSKMLVHQDWAYVDEKENSSVAIWFPLMDLDHHNGCLYFLKGNHIIKNSFRGPGIQCPYDNLHAEIEGEYSTKVPLKAGEVVIWDHRLIHWSPANLSDEPRIAATMILIPNKARLLHYYEPYGEKGSVEKFAVEDDFYMDYQIGNRPEKAESIGKYIYEFPMLERQDLDLLRERKTQLSESIREWVLDKKEQVNPIEPTTSAEAAPVGFLGRLKSLFS